MVFKGTSSELNCYSALCDIVSNNFDGDTYVEIRDSNVAVTNNTVQIILLLILLYKYVSFIISQFGYFFNEII